MPGFLNMLRYSYNVIIFVTHVIKLEFLSATILFFKKHKSDEN